MEKTIQELTIDAANALKNAPVSDFTPPEVHADAVALLALHAGDYSLAVRYDLFCSKAVREAISAAVR